MIGDPPLMGRLEGAGNAAERTNLLDFLGGGLAKSVAEDEDFDAFLSSREAALGDVMERLIHFPPIDRPGATGAGAVGLAPPAAA